MPGTRLRGRAHACAVWLGFLLKEQGIDDAFVTAHSREIAEAWDSFLIGSPAHRRDVEELLSKLPEAEREKARDERQDRNRSSMNQIGEAAYRYAKAYREAAVPS